MNLFLDLTLNLTHGWVEDSDMALQSKRFCNYIIPDNGVDPVLIITRLQIFSTGYIGFDIT